MAEVHVLPVRLDQVGAARLLASLPQVMQEGIGVAPRGPYISGLSCELEQKLATLRREAAWITEALDPAAPKTSAMAAAIEAFIHQVEAVIARARPHRS